MCGSDASSSWVKEAKVDGLVDKDAPLLLMNGQIIIYFGMT